MRPLLGGLLGTGVGLLGALLVLVSHGTAQATTAFLWYPPILGVLGCASGVLSRWLVWPIAVIGFSACIGVTLYIGIGLASGDAASLLESMQMGGTLGGLVGPPTGLSLWVRFRTHQEGFASSTEGTGD